MVGNRGLSHRLGNSVGPKMLGYFTQTLRLLLFAEPYTGAALTDFNFFEFEGLRNVLILSELTSR